MRRHAMLVLLLVLAVMLGFVLWVLLTDRPTIDDPRDGGATPVAPKTAWGDR